ncbi:hypothetical protein HKD37_03G008434 [Glycine soja]
MNIALTANQVFSFQFPQLVKAHWISPDTCENQSKRVCSVTLDSEYSYVRCLNSSGLWYTVSREILTGQWQRGGQGCMYFSSGPLFLIGKKTESLFRDLHFLILLSLMKGIAV